MIEVVTTKEFWAVIASGVAIVGTAVVKAYSEIKKIIDKNAKDTNESLLKTVNKTISNYNSIRGQQIRYAEDELSDYAVVVTQTAEIAASTMVCKPECDTLQEITELWRHAVHKTITKNVLGYVIHMIDKDEFRDKQDFEGWITEETKNIFNCFLTSMRSFFHAKKIRCRIDWVEQNMDRAFMRQVVSKIMYECRSLSIKFQENR